MVSLQNTAQQTTSHFTSRLHCPDSLKMTKCGSFTLRVLMWLLQAYFLLAPASGGTTGEGSAVGKVSVHGVQGCHRLTELQGWALLRGFANRLPAGGLEGRMLLLLLLLQADISVHSASDSSPCLPRKNLQLLRKKHARKKAPLCSAQCSEVTFFPRVTK